MAMSEEVTCGYLGTCVGISGEVPVMEGSPDCRCNNEACYVLRGPNEFLMFGRYRIPVCERHMEFLTCESSIRWRIEGTLDEAKHLLASTEAGKEGNDV